MWRHRVVVAAVGGWLAAAAVQAAHPWLAAGLVGAVVAALWFARVVPFAALVACVVAVFAVDVVGGGRMLEDPLLAALVYASYCVGRWSRLVLQPWAAAAVLLFLSFSLFGEEQVHIADVVAPVLITAAPWLLGLSVQLAERRAEGAELLAAGAVEGAQAQVRRAADAERLRIAHELHDVVAHHLSGVSLHAQLLRRRAEAGQAPSPSELMSLEQAARGALDELRRLLGVLRPAGGVAPTAPSEGLADLDALLAHARAAGQDVRLDVVGPPRELPPALSLVAYRILQECLTNARRHGARGPVQVRLAWLPGGLLITVTNPSPGPLAPEGYGRLGMAERARLFGGTVATHVEGGLWTVEVDLPTPAAVER